MKVGVIGPQISCEKVQKDLAVISPETKVQLYTREISAESIQVIDTCEAENDAILFTGLGPFTGVNKHHDIKIPYEVISKGLTSLSRVFIEMQKTGYHLDRFSIDVVEPNIMDDAFYEMDINPSEIYSYPFDSYVEKDYIQWHLKLWEEKKIDAMLTGFVWVYDFMKKQNYPIFYLPTMRSAVRDAFDRLESYRALKEARYSKISVELLRITPVSENDDSYYSDMIQKSKVESEIIKYAQKLQASFFHDGRNEYVIFANKGSTQNENNYQLLASLQKQAAIAGYRLNAGIGNALTAYQSESNARKALGISLQSKENYSYMIDVNHKLHGPLGQEQSLTYELVSTDETILEIAKKSGMNAVSVARLQSIIGVRKSTVFDVSQLADCLQLTPRSASRVAKRLVDAGFATVCATENGAGAGRPKSLFDITF